MVLALSDRCLVFNGIIHNRAVLSGVMALAVRKGNGDYVTDAVVFQLNYRRIKLPC